MISRRTIEWINQELDAVSSARQSARLHRQLEKDPEAQAYFDSLKKLDGMLERVEQVEPPASLKIGIVNAVRASATPTRSRVSVVESILSRLSNPAVPRYGFAVASGICIGMLLFAVTTGEMGSTTGPEHVSGAIGVYTAPAGTVTDYGVFESISANASIQVVESGLHVYIEAEIDGLDSYVFSVRFSSDAYMVTGIRREAGILNSTQTEAGLVSTHIDGPGRVIVELDRGGTGTPPVQIVLRQGESVIWEKTLKTAAGE